MNLKVVMEPNNEEKNSKKINPSDNPKCLLLIKKIKKFLETIDVRLQEKNLKTVVELYRI